MKRQKRQKRRSLHQPLASLLAVLQRPVCLRHVSHRLPQARGLLCDARKREERGGVKGRCRCNPTSLFLRSKARERRRVCREACSLHFSFLVCVSLSPPDVP
jgi:hypothetical protein